MDLPVTDLNSEENKDLMNKTPIFNFKYPERPIGMDSSLDSLPVLEPDQAHTRELSTVSPFLCIDDVNVGYPLLPRNDSTVPEQSLEDTPVGMNYGTEHTNRADIHTPPARIEKVEQLKLAATLEEQLILARQLILKAQRDVRRRDKGRGGRGWMMREREEGNKGEGTMEEERNCNGVRDSREVRR